jgi:hypothetical protein
MRKTGIALSALALAVTLGACGDKGSDNGGANPDGGGNAPAAMANVADLAKSIGDQTAEKTSAHMVFTGDMAGQKLTGEGDVSFAAGNAAISMDVETPEGAMSMVLVDDIFYMKMPAGQELEPGKPWLKIDPNSDSQFAELFGSLTEQLSQSADPRKALEQFEEIGKITDSKEEDLNGEPTTHYTVTVDTKDLAASVDDPAQKEAIEQSGLEEFTVDVWINEEDLPVRVSTDMAAPDGQGGTAPVKIQVDYTKWGEPVDITAPPADQVTEFPTS